MRSTLTLLIVQLLLVSNVRAATVKLIVTVPDSTPTDASIYLAGSLPSVGEWKVDGVKLDREGDRFVSTIQLEGDQTLEFKITRGSWETVEKNRDGSERANRLLDAKHAEVSVTVEAWSTGIEKPAPSVVGTLEIFTIDSKSLNQQRTIRVWLPPGYADASDRKFPVLYMHDGQNCFDRATSAFGVEWQIDETLTKLISDGTIAPMIVVGMDNGGASRTKNYTFDIDKERGGGGAAHANFLIDEVIPQIESRYRVRTDRASRMVGGSSLGGLMSLEIVRRHSDVFSGALVMSPSLWWSNEAIIKAIEADPSQLANSRLWIDVGTNEGSGKETSRYVESVKKLDAILTKANVEHHLMIQESAEHNEAAWARRFGSAIMYLMDQ